jgi:hypothetical protein
MLGSYDRRLLAHILPDAERRCAHVQQPQQLLAAVATLYFIDAESG